MPLGRVVGCLIVVLLGSSIFAQTPSTEALERAPFFLREQLQPKTFHPGRMPLGDWQDRIDELWGPGLPTAQKLEVFDRFWQTIDRQFACFQSLKTDWAGLRARYRPEIETGVSRGRFAAIMGHLAMALRESHTSVIDPLVQLQTYPAPGVPLIYVDNWGYDAHSGACLTPLEDGSLLVYDVVPDHPLGLEPGDRVLGYDGLEWRRLYPELLRAELPVSGFWASSPIGFEHGLQSAAGRNWHLFETVDIAKHSTGETLHLPTRSLEVSFPYLYCSEQIDVAGVSKPDPSAGSIVSWGIIDGEKIGYIYGWGWFWEAGTEFRDAVNQIMFDHETSGLIIDFRHNVGGNMFLSNDGLALLFDETVATINWASRGPSGDHDDMVNFPDSYGDAYRIYGSPHSFYDKPIAVLTGPGAVSSGDQVALRMKFHPRVRTFGKTTAAAFNSPVNTALPHGFVSRYAPFEAYLLSDPTEYLTHDEFAVDHPVWLQPEDVAAGVDTVVQAAVDWIRQTQAAHPWVRDELDRR